MSQSYISSRIAVIEGDITEQKVDAIVNPTDEWFSGAGYVDRAIHRAAGSQLTEVCDKLKKGWSNGQAQITNGYNLPTRWVHI
ncbi:macro domain-containing protein [Iningainema sp. BLCCT55]|uniref:Macro domain-containing protein n=1 Tax=Iningainema tapete BLCC-T55 TaxID=2748662 RepID=A0A8J7C8A6_9CYAN|nr:macro domain-containing protein [Iningainema tapete BLCC-T55]